jgi:hypothetical protein
MSLRNQPAALWRLLDLRLPIHRRSTASQAWARSDLEVVYPPLQVDWCNTYQFNGKNTWSMFVPTPGIQTLSFFFKYLVSGNFRTLKWRSVPQKCCVDLPIISPDLHLERRLENTHKPSQRGCSKYALKTSAEKHTRTVHLEHTLYIYLCVCVLSVCPAKLTLN